MWCCVLFSCFIGISGGFGVLKPRIHHLSFSGPKMAFSSSQNTTFYRENAQFRSETYYNIGEKKTQRDKWLHFHACTNPPLKTPLSWFLTFFTYGLSSFTYDWSLSLAVNWLGLSHLRLKFRLVCFACGGKSVWSCLVLTVAPIRKLGLVFSA